MKQEIFSIDHLNVSYRQGIFTSRKIHVIKDASIRVHENEIVMIQGGNGTGKSSIMNAIINPNKETHYQDMRFCGETVDDIKTLRKNISYVEQNDEASFGFYTGAELVRQNATLATKHQVNYENVDADALFKFFSAEDLKYKKLSRMSGGERRLITLLSAFARKTRLYIIDEPINNLDLERSKRVGEFLQKLKQYPGVGVLLITHCRMYLQATKAYELSDDGSLKLLDNPPRMCTVENGHH